MCWYLKDAKTIEELYLQIAVLDISIQALIKKSEKEVPYLKIGRIS